MTFELGADGSQVFGLIDEIGAALDAKVSSFTDSLASGIADAVSGVDSLGSALDQVTQNFATGLSGALDIISSAEITPPNTQPIETAVSDAITTAAETPVDVTNVDAGQLTFDIDSAIQDANTNVPVTGDATEITTDIDSAIQASDATNVPVTGDATEVTTAIDDAVAAADTTEIPITADTTQAEASFADLGGTAAEAQGPVDGLKASTSNLGLGAGIAAGDIEGLAGSMKGLPGQAGEIAGAFAAVVGAVSGLAEEGIKAESATQRFDSIFGKLGSTVKTVDIPGLSTNIETLGLRLGSTRAATEDALATLGAFFSQAGLGGKQVADLTQQTFLLAARAEALKPSLGSVADIANTLPQKLAAGARGFRTLGLAVSQAEVLQRAYNDTGKTSVAQLTPQEKAIAAVEVAYSKLGNTLGGTIQAAYQNVLIQQKSVLASLQDTFETLGQPIVVPFLATLQAAQPLVTTFGTAIQDMGRVILPVLAPVIDGIGRVGTEVLASFAPAINAMVPAATELGQALGQLVVALGPTLEAATSSSVAFVTAIAPLVQILADVVRVITPFIEILSGALSVAIHIVTAPLQALGASLHFVADEFTSAVPAVEHFLGPVGTAAKSVIDFGTGIAHTVGGLFGLGASADAAHPKVKSLGDQIRELAASQKDQQSAEQQKASTELATDVATQKVSRSTVDLIAHQLGLNSASDDYASVLAHVNGLLGITGSQQTQYTATLVEQQAAEASIFTTLLQESSVRQQLSTAITGNAQAVQLLASAAGAGIKIDPAQFTALAGAMGVSEKSAQAFFDTFKTGIDDVVKRADAGLPKIEDAFKGAVDKAGNVDWGKLRGNLDKTLGDIVHEVDNFKTLVSLGLGGAADFLVQQGPAALGGAVRHIFQDKNGLADLQHDNFVITAATQATTGAEQYFQSQGLPIANSLNGWGIPIGNAASTQFGTIPNAATGAVGDAAAALTAAATGPAGLQFNAAGGLLINSFNSGLVAQGGAAAVAAEQISANASTELGRGADLWGTAGKQSGDAATAGAVFGLSPLPGAATGAGAQGAAALGLTGPQFFGGGQGAAGQGVSGVAQGFIVMGQIVGNIIAAQIISAMNIAQSDASSSELLLGSHIAGGIAGGVRGAAESIAGATVYAVQGALAAGQQAAHVKSPSTLFADELGAPIAEGIAAGIRDSNAPTVAIAGQIDTMRRNAIDQLHSLDFAGQLGSQFAGVTLATPSAANLTIPQVAVATPAPVGNGTIDQSQTTVNVTVQHQPGADMAEVHAQGETIGTAALDKIDQARRARLSVEPL